VSYIEEKRSGRKTGVYLAQSIRLNGKIRKVSKEMDMVGHHLKFMNFAVAFFCVVP